MFGFCRQFYESSSTIRGLNWTTHFIINLIFILVQTLCMPRIFFLLYCAYTENLQRAKDKGIKSQKKYSAAVS